MCQFNRLQAITHRSSSRFIGARTRKGLLWIHNRVDHARLHSSGKRTGYGMVGHTLSLIPPGSRQFRRAFHQHLYFRWHHMLWKDPTSKCRREDVVITRTRNLRSAVDLPFNVWFGIMFSEMSTRVNQCAFIKGSVSTTKEIGIKSKCNLNCLLTSGVSCTLVDIN